MTVPRQPDLHVELPDGRRIAVDDRGDPAGRPMLYVHGTPDSRLARHPDDSIAAGLGIRLIAVDRPGIGGSDPDPEATPGSVAADHVAVMDHLGVDRTAVVSWSAGSITALALAGGHPERISSLTLVAPLIPADAYADERVLEGAGDGRRLFGDALGSTTPDELGRELAPWLAPPDLDADAVREVLTEALQAVADVEGAADRLIAARLAATPDGDLTGMDREIAAQATPFGALLDAITAPVTVHVGERDTVTPPAMARWLAERLDATLVVHDDAGHELAITRWQRILADLVSR